MSRSHLSVRMLLGFIISLLAISFGVSAQEITSTNEVAPRDTGHFLMFTGVNFASDCDQMQLNIFRSRPESVIYVSSVFYKGQQIIDDVTNLGIGYGSSSYLFFYADDRGKAVDVDPFPLTPGKPLDIFVTVFSLDWQPLYEARAYMESCDATEIASETHGPAYQLIENHSFEQAGVDSTYAPDPDKAAFWKGSNADNDTRVCAPPRTRGGSSNYVGDCGLLLIADGLLTTKFKQSYNGTIGAAGDIAYLLAHAQAFSYGGGGKIKAKLTLTDGSVVKLKRSFPAGDYLFLYPYDAYIYLTAPIASAKVIIKQPPTGGNLALDAITLSVFTNTNQTPRALPLPEA